MSAEVASTKRDGARTWAFVVILTLLALAVRLVGIDYGVPVWEEPDPDIPIHVDLLRDDTVRANREFSERQYPHLVAHLVSLLPARPAADGPNAPTTVEEHLAFAAHTHVQSRIVVALLSVLLVPLTFMLARRFLGPGSSLLAATLVATSLLHVHFAQQARPHGAASTFFLASVLCSMRLVRRPDLSTYLAAGLAAALAIGSLHSGVAVLIPLVVASWLRPGGGGLRLGTRLVVPALMVAGAIRVFYPFLFDGSDEARPAADNTAEPSVEDATVTWAEHSVGLDEFVGGGFRVVFESLWNYDPLLLLAALVGVLAWTVQRVLGTRPPWTGPDDDLRRRELWVALAFAVPYFVVIGLFGKTYERFAIPLLPFMACAAAWGLDWLGRRPNTGAAVRLVALCALVLVPTAAAIKLTWLRAQPDTLDKAAVWIERSVRPAPEGPPIWILAPLDLPLLRTDESWAPPGRKRRALYSPWSKYQVRADLAGGEPRWDLRWIGPAWTTGGENPAEDPGGFLDALGPGLFVIEVFEERVDHRLEVALRRALQVRGERLARFAPEGSGVAPGPLPDAGSERPFFYQLSDHFNDGEVLPWPHFVRRLFGARAVGPVLEVYRVD